MASAKGKKKPAKNQEKSFTFTVTLPEMIGLCAGGIVALCAFFVLGILLGRGYQPEKDVPELAMMIPSQAANGSGEVKGGVLKPEELDYIDQLKKKPEPAFRQESDQKKKVALKKASKPAVKPESKEKKKTPKQVVEQKPVEIKEPAVEMDNPDEVTEPVYNYIYQVASFGDSARAVEFSDKIRSSGLDAFVESGKGGSRIWYRVFVRHTGTPDSTNGMKAVLRKFGIKKPLMKSKVPVS